MQAIETAQAQAGVDHGLGIDAHFAGSARVKDRYAVRAQIIFPLIIGRDIRPRREFCDHMLGKRRRGEIARSMRHPRRSTSTSRWWSRSLGLMTGAERMSLPWIVSSPRLSGRLTLGMAVTTGSSRTISASGVSCSRWE